ncbi:MAG: Alanine racemase, partial [Bacteroidota bacterium]|nr:Alanine racemase [Bacteroidota bacterium]
MRTTVVEIDKQKLLQNFRILKSMVNGASVMAIVKANGYGHGLTEVSKILEEA